MADASAHFPATRWTLLQALREGSQAVIESALDELCKAYWSPLYLVARQSGLSVHDAEDSVQGFFASILEREALLKADQTQGKLRTYLLSAYDRYRINVWRGKVALKRGAGVEPVSPSESKMAEARYLEVAAEGAGVETLYNREWARSLLERGMAALRKDYDKEGQAGRFADAVVHLTQPDTEETLAETARRLGLTPAALRQYLFRMRRRYREKIEDELAVTLGTRDPEVLRQEMLDLFKAF